MHYYNKYLEKIFMKASKFSADFMRCGREFSILGPKLLRVLVPPVTSLTTGISKFNLYLN